LSLNGLPPATLLYSSTAFHRQLNFPHSIDGFSVYLVVNKPFTQVGNHPLNVPDEDKINFLHKISPLSSITHLINAHFLVNQGKVSQREAAAAAADAICAQLISIKLN
jgi:hypothetical protein